MDSSSRCRLSPVNEQILPPTSSRCLTQSFTATHDFKVSSFWKLKGMGVGEFKSSSIFTVGGCDWNLRLYPKGSTPTANPLSSKKYASVFLAFLEGEPGDRVDFSLSLLDGAVPRKKQGGKRRGGAEEEEKVLKLRHGSLKLESAGQPPGRRKFIAKFELPKRRFTIRCVLTVTKTRTDDTFAVPQPSLPRYFAHKLKDMEDADMAINVGGQLFPAHRYVLAARPEVLRSQLFGRAEELNYTDCIKVDDMDPAVFEGLLHFIYTDTLPDTSTTRPGGREQSAAVVQVQGLLAAADRYGLERLRFACEQRLRSCIDVESVATSLCFAQRYRCDQLKDDCLRFIADHGALDAVVGTEGFEHLLATYPLLIKEILGRRSASSKIE